MFKLPNFTKKKEDKMETIDAVAPKVLWDKAWENENKELVDIVFYKKVKVKSEDRYKPVLHRNVIFRASNGYLVESKKTKSGFVVNTYSNTHWKLCECDRQDGGLGDFSGGGESFDFDILKDPEIKKDLLNKYINSDYICSEKAVAEKEKQITELHKQIKHMIAQRQKAKSMIAELEACKEQ